MRALLVLSTLALTLSTAPAQQQPTTPAWVQGTLELEANITSTINGQPGPAGPAPLELDYAGDPRTGGTASLYTLDANNRRILLSVGRWEPALLGFYINFRGDFFGDPNGYIRVGASTVSGGTGYINANDNNGITFSGPCTTQ